MRHYKLYWLTVHVRPCRSSPFIQNVLISKSEYDILKVKKNWSRALPTRLSESVFLGMLRQ